MMGAIVAAAAWVVVSGLRVAPGCERRVALQLGRYVGRRWPEPSVPNLLLGAPHGAGITGIWAGTASTNGQETSRRGSTAVRVRAACWYRASRAALLSVGAGLLTPGAARLGAQPAAPVALTRSDVVARLAGASDANPLSLAGQDLSQADLSGLDLSHVNFEGARLAGARLVRAKLFSANLDRAAAEHADLTGAILDVATMRGANFSHATLRSASLYAVVMPDADFSDADLSGARIIASATNAKFVRANLTHADIGADPNNQPMGLMRTDLSDADLTGADLSGANLRKARLVRANLTGANLTDADVALAVLTDAVLRDIRGRSAIKNLDHAIGVDDAHFDPAPRP